MATVISTMSVELSLDATGFNRQMEAVGTKLKETGDRIRGIGTTLTATVTTPIVAGFGAAVWAASDLNETMNKTNVVFGDAANSVMAWSQDSATAFGLSQNEALGFASTFGNIFTGMGMTGEAAADLSTNFVQLGADLGSFNNVPTAEALDAIRAGVMGEYEPLRRFGIVLTEAEVNAKALEMGLVDANGEVTEAGKVAARTALIQEKSANAQGDFANTSGSLANQMKILRARLTNMAASIGQVLLPYVTRVVGWLAQWADKFTELSDRSRKIVVIVGLIVAAIGPLLIAIGTVAGVAGSVAKNFGMIVKVMKAVRVATMASLGPFLIIIAILAALYFVWTKDLFGIRTKIEKWFAIFKAPGGGLDKLKLKFEQLKKVVSDFAGKALAKAADLLKRFIDAVRGPAAQAFDVFKRVLSSLIGFVGMVIGGIIARLDPLKSAFYGVVAMIQGFVDLVRALLDGDLRGALDAAKDIFMGWLQYITGLGEFLLSAMSGVLGYLWDALAAVDWVGLGTTLLDYLKSAVGYVVGLAGELGAKAADMVGGFVDWLAAYDWATLGATLLGYLQIVTDAVVDLGGKLGTKASEMVAGFVDWLTAYDWAALGATLLGYLQIAIDAVVDIGGKLATKASDMVAGFVDYLAAYDWAGLGTTLLGYIVDAINLYIDLYTYLATKAVDLLQGLWDWLRDYDWAGLGTTLLGYIVDAIGLYIDLYTYLAEKAVDLLQGLWDWLRDYDWAGLATTLLGYIVDAIELYVKLYKTLLTAASDLVTGFADWIRDYDWAGLGTKILGYIGDAIEAIGDVGDLLWNLGYDIVWGLGEGIRNNASKFVQSAIDWAIGLIPGWARDILEAFSPSRVMMGVGKDVIDGVAVGITRNIDTVKSAVDDMASVITDTEIGPPQFADIATAWDAAGGMTVGGRMVATAAGMATAGAGTWAVTINVNGSTDPAATAEAVFSRLNRELGLRGPI